MKTRIHIYLIVLLSSPLFMLFSCEKKEETVKIKFEKVTGFTIDEQGVKLLATDKGLFYLNEKNNEFEQIETTPDFSVLTDLTHSNSSPENELWLASNKGVLNFTSQTSFSSENSQLHTNAINHIHFDKNNKAFFASNNKISILDDNKWSVTSGQNDFYKKHEITDISSAENEFIYVTTNGGGVERFKTDVDGISSATVFDTDWSKLESNIINTVFIDGITQAYGTNAGVAIHSSQFTKWDWQVYKTDDGLINDKVISVVKDKENNWWFGTPEGISRFNNSIWTNYTLESHNLISNNIKFLAVDIDGSIWFACNEGLAHFDNNQWTNFIN